MNQRDGAQSVSAGADGATWTPEPGRVSSTVSSISDVGAALRADGTPVYSYTYSFVLGLHSGLDPGVTDTDLLPENKCCAYHPDVAFSESGEGYVGWYSNVDGEAGLYVQQIAPTQGEKQLVPQSVTNEKLLSIDQRMPIVARKGITGDIARENATRNPRRTTWSAAALLIGVGVVSLFTILLSSFRTSIFELHEAEDASTAAVRRRMAHVLRSVTEGHELQPDLRIRRGQRLTLAGHFSDRARIVPGLRTPFAGSSAKALTAPRSIVDESNSPPLKLIFVARGEIAC